LIVGRPGFGISAKFTAAIRLHYVEGMDKDSCPAIVCCGGRMDFHGAPIVHSWLKLGAPAAKGDTTLALGSTTGWNPGDRIIVTATTRQIKSQKTFRTSVRDNTQTEE